MKNSKKFYVTIAFGSSVENEGTHFFNTEEEKEAFIEGVDIGCGWMDYHELKQGTTTNEKEERAALEDGFNLLNDYRKENGWEPLTK